MKNNWNRQYSLSGERGARTKNRPIKNQKRVIFSQGSPADSVFYIQKGRANSLSFPQALKKQQSGSSPHATPLERNRSTEWSGQIDLNGYL